jgi:hypothetical protein
MVLHLAESSKMRFVCIMVVSAWDTECKKRLQQLEDYFKPIAAWIFIYSETQTKQSLCTWDHIAFNKKLSLPIKSEI